jgi:hypothetical protein
LGIPQAEHFEIRETPTAPPRDGEMMIRLYVGPIEKAKAAQNVATPRQLGSLFVDFGSDDWTDPRIDQVQERAHDRSGPTAHGPGLRAARVAAAK